MNSLSELLYYFYYPNGFKSWYAEDVTVMKGLKREREENKRKQTFITLLKLRAVDKTNDEFFKSWFFEKSINNYFIFKYSNRLHLKNIIRSLTCDDEYSGTFANASKSLDKFHCYTLLEPVQCKAPTSKKIRCKNNTFHNNGLCFKHQDYTGLLTAPSFVI